MHRRIAGALRPLVVGGVIGLAAFGAVFVLFGFVADSEVGMRLTEEDGFVETAGAAAFGIAAVLQFALFWRSDVPAERRLIPVMRRNPFYLGLALVLFLAFGEEISWGQRIIGWETPAFLLAANAQGETNFHNLTPLQGEHSLLNVHRLGNIFWLGYCVLLPLGVAVIAWIAAISRRVSLPVPPLWIGGLFVGCYASFRLFFLEFSNISADAGEVQEALLATCFIVLGIAQLRNIHLGRGGLSRAEGS